MFDGKMRLPKKGGFINVDLDQQRTYCPTVRKRVPHSFEYDD